MTCPCLPLWEAPATQGFQVRKTRVQAARLSSTPKNSTQNPFCSQRALLTPCRLKGCLKDDLWGGRPAPQAPDPDYSIVPTS